MGNPVLKPWDCYVPFINNINYKLQENNVSILLLNGIVIVLLLIKAINLHNNIHVGNGEGED